MIEELKKSRENYAETAKLENEQLANVMAFADEMETNKDNIPVFGCVSNTNLMPWFRR